MCACCHFVFQQRADATFSNYEYVVHYTLQGGPKK